MNKIGVLSVEEHIEYLSKLILGVLSIRNFSSYAIIQERDTSYKIECSKHVFSCQKLVLVLNTRVKELTSDNAINKFDGSLVANCVEKEINNFKGQQSIDKIISNLTLLIIDFRSKLGCILDEATLSILEDIGNKFIEISPNASQHCNNLPIDNKNIKFQNLQTWYNEIKWFQIPTLPNRDLEHIILNHSEYTCDKTDLNAITCGRAFNLELSACEIYAMMLLRFSPLPLDCEYSLAKQCRDEGRHALLLLSILDEEQIDINKYPKHFGLWTRVFNEDTFVKCLTSQAVIGEGYSLGNDIDIRNRYLNINKPNFAKIFDHIYIDEIQHVKEGLHWFSFFAGKDKEQVLSEVEQNFPPLNPKVIDINVREYVGFTADQIRKQQKISEENLLV